MQLSMFDVPSQPAPAPSSPQRKDPKPSRAGPQPQLFAPLPPPVDANPWSPRPGVPISVDYETFFDESQDISISVLGMYHYVSHPATSPYLVSFSDGVTSWVGDPRKFNWECIAGRLWVSHNNFFDGLVHARVQSEGVTDVSPGEWVCTAQLAVYLGHHRDLKGAAKDLLNVDVDKDARKQMDGRTWEEMVQAGVAAQVIEYARRDATTCWVIWDQHNQKWPEIERRVGRLTNVMASRGIYLAKDVDDRLAAIRIATWDIQQTLPKEMLAEVEGGGTGVSPTGLASACAAANISAPTERKKNARSGAWEEKIVTSKDSPAFEAWIDENEEKLPWVASIGKLRKALFVRDLLAKMVARKRPDGCLTAEIKYFEACTGRWAGGGGINLQGLPGKAVSGVDVRSSFVARPGHKLVIADLSQIEPRILLWLINDQVMLETIRRTEPLGWTIYDAHAVATMGWPESRGSLKAAQKEAGPASEEARIYKLAKARVIGLGYGCGAAKFVTVAKKMAGLDISLAAAKEQVADFRSKNPAIFDFHRQLDRDMRRSVGGDYAIELPSWRSLVYRNVINRDGEYLGLTRTKGSPAYKKLYGGLLCENVVQALARDMFAVGALRIEEELGQSVLMLVHDEVVVEVPADYPMARVVTALTTPPDWLEGCPISAEAEESQFYKK